MGTDPTKERPQQRAVGVERADQPMGQPVLRLGVLVEDVPHLVGIMLGGPPRSEWRPPLARCTPRNQPQTPAKQRYERIACNTQTLVLASLGRLGLRERDYGMQEVVGSSPIGSTFVINCNLASEPRPIEQLTASQNQQAVTLLPVCALRDQESVDLGRPFANA